MSKYHKIFNFIKKTLLNAGKVKVHLKNVYSLFSHSFFIFYFDDFPNKLGKTRVKYTEIT